MSWNFKDIKSINLFSTVFGETNIEIFFKNRCYENCHQYDKIVSGKNQLGRNCV